jgi:hypothetical protein
VGSNSPPPPPENHAVYEIMWKNNVERCGSQMSIWRMCIACWVPKATHRHAIYNTYCFSAATVVAKTRLNVALVRTLHVLFSVKLVGSYNGWSRTFTRELRLIVHCIASTFLQFYTSPILIALYLERV